MTGKELLKLINRGENQTVSLKSLKAKPSVLSRPMVSFSNTGDGVIVIGVDDKTRKVYGAKTTKQKEEGLDNIHKASKQCCQPNVDISMIEEIKTSNRAYREIFRVSAATAKRELGDLIEKGICRTAGAGRSLHYILK